MVEKISYQYFNQLYIPHVNQFGFPIVFVTHDFTYEKKKIDVGTYKGLTVAIKSGANLEHELEMYKKIGHHKNIVKLIAEVEDGKYSYILMEGIKNGITLSKYCQWSANQTALSMNVCIQLMKQLASALNHLHALGIIHHDLKSENVLVDFERDEIILKLCDFGLSECVDHNGHGKEENRQLGTYSILAPEQKWQNAVLYNQPITTKIDVYAFSYLCNTILLKGRSLEASVRHVPIKLLYLIEQCGMINPHDRPNMKEIIKIFDHLLSTNLDEEETYHSLITKINKSQQNTCIELT